MLSVVTGIGVAMPDWGVLATQNSCEISDTQVVFEAMCVCLRASNGAQIS